MDDKYFIRIAIGLARESAEKGGDPFGAVLVYRVKLSQNPWIAASKNPTRLVMPN